MCPGLTLAGGLGAASRHLGSPPEDEAGDLWLVLTDGLGWGGLGMRSTAAPENQKPAHAGRDRVGRWVAPLTGPLSTVCNVTTCPQDPPECGPGQELTYIQEQGSCCPNFGCREWSRQGGARLGPLVWGLVAWRVGRAGRGPGALSPPLLSGPQLCDYNGTVYGVRAWPRHGAGRATGQVGCPSPSVSCLTSTFLPRGASLRLLSRAVEGWPPCLLVHFSFRDPTEGRQDALWGPCPWQTLPT